MSELPKGWVEAELGELLELKYGKSLPKKDRVPGPYKVFGSNGVVGTSESALTGEPVIVVGRKGSFGEVNFSENRCFPIDTTYYVDRFDALQPRFAERLLKHLPLKELNRATAIPGLNREDAYRQKTYLPPLAEQKRIVGKLDALSAKSARARAHLARIETLTKRYKQAVLSKAFREVDANTVTVRELSHFVTSGSRGWAKYYSDLGALFLRVGNTARSGIDLELDDRQYVSPPLGSEGERTRVQENDVLVTITADLGRVAVIPADLGEAYVNQHIALLRLKDPNQAKFIAWYMASANGQADLHRHDRGATRAGLGLNDIRDLLVPVPTSAEQTQIVSRIEAAFAKIDKLAAEAKRALELTARLDEAILAKAFRGELVPQDPNDEPASVLLDRIKAERANAPKPKRGRGKKA